MRKNGRRKIDGMKLDGFRIFKGVLFWFIVIVVIFQCIIGVSMVRGDSMYPTLRDGQFVVYSRIIPTLEQGDVVSVKMPSGEYYVKRVIAVEGDVVDLKDGQLYVNGQAETGAYVNGRTEQQEGVVAYPYTVEKDKLFVVGDNRTTSIDSRAFGAVMVQRVQGKLFFVN